MAYLSKETKANLAIGIKKVLKKHNMKGTISIRHNSMLVVKLPKGSIDFTELLNGRGECVVQHIEHVHKNTVFGLFLQELQDAMNGRGTDVENYDSSVSMCDHFDVGWYTNIEIGQYDKPYELI